MLQKQLDWATFASRLATTLVVRVSRSVFADRGGRLVLRSYQFIDCEFGFSGMRVGTALMVLPAWLACSGFGPLIPGTDCDRPEFRIAAAMLFCAGAGRGLISASLLNQLCRGCNQSSRNDAIGTRRNAPADAPVPKDRSLQAFNI